MEKLQVCSGRKRYAIPLQDIVYMEKLGKKVVLYTIEEKVEFYSTFRQVMEQLDERFARPHCSFILNMDYYDRIDEKQVIFSNGVCIPMGRDSMARAKKIFDIRTVGRRKKPCS